MHNKTVSASQDRARIIFDRQAEREFQPDAISDPCMLYGARHSVIECRCDYTDHAVNWEAVMRDINGYPGVQAWWRLRSHWFSEEFVKFVNQLQETAKHPRLYREPMKNE
jgi:hypothetical protein